MTTMTAEVMISHLIKVSNIINITEVLYSPLKVTTRKYRIKINDNNIKNYNRIMTAATAEVMTLIMTVSFILVSLQEWTKLYRNSSSVHVEYFQSPKIKFFGPYLRIFQTRINTTRLSVAVPLSSIFNRYIRALATLII